jgi:hypothetical protein
VATARLHCSESIYFVGLAISACLLPSSPRPTCTADSSAALRATAPVRSLVHAWPCSAPLQPLLPLPFPAPPVLVIFCAHLTFHHSLSGPITHFPPTFPYAFLTALCPCWHIYCLDTGFERLPLVCLTCWRYRWKRLILFFPKSPRILKFDNFLILSLLHVTRAEYTNSMRARTDNRINSVPQLYLIDPGTFRVALLICYPQRCWNFVIVILSKCCGVSPWPRPTATPDVYPCPTLRNVGIRTVQITTFSCYMDGSRTQPLHCRLLPHQHDEQQDSIRLVSAYHGATYDAFVGGEPRSTTEEH